MKKYLKLKWIVTAYFIVLGLMLTINVLPAKIVMPLLTIAGIFIMALVYLIIGLIVFAVVVCCVRIIRGQHIFLRLIVLSAMLFSCQKEQVKTPDAVEIGKSIGMDMNQWHVANKCDLPAGMVAKQFNSIEEARVYFLQYGFRQPTFVESSGIAGNEKTIDAIVNIVKTKEPYSYLDEKTIRDMVKNAVANRVDPDDPDQPSNTVTLTTVILYSSYTVNFTWTRGNLGFGTGGGYYAASGTTSHMGGVGGTAWGWTQTGTSYYNYPNSSIIHVVVTAKQSFNFKIKEWDGIYQHDMRIEIDYNVKDGTYHMYVWNNAVGH